MLLASPYRTGTDGLQHIVPCAPTGVSVERVQAVSTSTGNGSVDAFFAYSGKSVHPAHEEWPEIEARFERWWTANQAWGFEVVADERKAYTAALRVLQKCLNSPTRIVTESKSGISRILGLPVISSIAALIARKRQQAQEARNAAETVEESDMEIGDTTI